MKTLEETLRAFAVILIVLMAFIGIISLTQQTEGITSDPYYYG